MKGSDPRSPVGAAGNTNGPLGIIAGGGGLPATVARAAQAQGREVFIVTLEGFADSELSAFPSVRLRVSQAARILSALRKAGCREVVLVGAMQRPGSWLRDVGPSFLWLAIKNLDLLMSGDASLLSRIIKVLEDDGLIVRGAHEIATQLVVPQGPLGAVRPSKQSCKDIAQGLHVAGQLGVLDIGQGVVVAGGRVLAVEAAEGTDHMLARVGALRAKLPNKPVGVLVKCPQPIQDRRVDMPTIGPTTVRNAAAAGLAGIAIVAGQVLVAEPEETRQLADDLGLFVEAVLAPKPDAGA
ncbi:MAG: LpxI family protein [Alphaproteobacteria bacterium]